MVVVKIKDAFCWLWRWFRAIIVPWLIRLWVFERRILFDVTAVGPRKTHTAWFCSDGFEGQFLLVFGNRKFYELLRSEYKWYAALIFDSERSSSSPISIQFPNMPRLYEYPDMTHWFAILTQWFANFDAMICDFDSLTGDFVAFICDMEALVYIYNEMIRDLNGLRN